MKSYILILSILLSFSSLAQEQLKDTLFIKYDINLLSSKHDTIEKNTFHIIKGTGNNGFVYFLEVEKLYNLNHKKINCLKNILRRNEFTFKSKYINQDKIGKLNDWILAKYFSKYILFLVNDKDFIKVEARYEIE